MTIESLITYFFSFAAVVAAVFMVAQKNPMLSAISLIANFFCLAGLYLMLHAQLLAVLQIVVYTGAIMVLVIFVIMLLNLGDEKKLIERFDMWKIAGIIIVAGFLLEMIYIFGWSLGAGSNANLSEEAARIGEVEAMGRAMFSKFLLPFEVTSILLLVAIVGAVVLAKKRT